MVKYYLTRLDDVSDVQGVAEMQMPFHAPAPAQDGPPWLVNGEWVYTRDGKPRQPGALRGKYKPVTLEDLETPDWLIEIMENGDNTQFDPLP
jgi:hypothetical protein